MKFYSKFLSSCEFIKTAPKIVKNIKNTDTNIPSHKVLGKPNKNGSLCPAGITKGVKVSITNTTNKSLQKVQIFFFIINPKYYKKQPLLFNPNYKLI